MRVFRRMLETPWTEHTRNDDVLKRMQIDGERLDRDQDKKNSMFTTHVATSPYEIFKLVEGRRRLEGLCSWLKSIHV